MASDALVVNGGRLSKLQSRPRLDEYIKEIWQVRRFIVLNARTRANLNGRDTFLGRAWVILDPILQTAFYGFVFGMVLNVSKGMDNFPGYLAIGVVFFRVATRGLTSGIGLVRRSRALISSFSFSISLTSSLVLDFLTNFFLLSFSIFEGLPLFLGFNPSIPSSLNSFTHLAIMLGLLIFTSLASL